MNCRIEVYQKVETKNILNEIDFKYVKIRSIWAEILPQSGNVKNGLANTISAEISHKFIIRANAIKDITNDMYFVYKNQKYNIKYFIPNYKKKDRIEVFCSLEVE